MFHEHRQHEAWWWYKIKVTTKEASCLTKDANLAPDEAPGEHCVSKCLRLTMDELWEVLLDCGLARKKGLAYIIDRQKVDEFITRNVIECGEKDKQHVLRIGVYSAKSTKSDYSTNTQWKSDKKPPRPFCKELKTFRDDLKEFLVPKKTIPTTKDTSPHQQTDSSPRHQTDSSPQSPSPLIHSNPLKTFLSKILQSPEAMDCPSF